MMKQLALIALPVLFLSGCAVEEIAQTAADSAACQAMKGTISGLQVAYEAGLVDSGVLEQVDEIAGDQLEALLSSGLAADLRALRDELAATEPAQSAGDRIATLTDSITARCAEVGVNVE
jgi:PBP1b-binding outer membrane lipoprotein LpoB